MIHTQLGSTSLHITPITLGTMQFRWTTTENEAYRILDHYFEAGGNLIDTADMYTQWAPNGKGGEAETIIGKWLKKRKNRSHLFLSSKVRSKMWEGLDGEGLGRKHIIRACEETLNRLQTEYLDLYFSHWPDETTEEEETLLAYQTLIDKGKIRYLGCSNYSPKQLSSSLELKRKGLPEYAVIQVLYNLIDRHHFERELLPIVNTHLLGVLAYSPLSSGFLTGLYRQGKPLPKNVRSDFVKTKMTPNNLALIEALEELSVQHKATISQIALAWLLQQKTISGLITGADTVEQLEENLGAYHVHLSKSECDEIEKLFTD